METRNISLTLEKAKEWYNRGSTDLREVALQAYTEEELEELRFKRIQTMYDVFSELELDSSEVNSIIRRLEKISKASAAMFKLNLIRKALNMGQKMSFTEGTMWYPYTPCVTTNSTRYKEEIKSGTMKKILKVSIGGGEYYLLGGLAHDGGRAGLGDFDSHYGVATSYANVGFLGCATREIAEHMSKYFAQEIFEAKYGDIIKYSFGYHSL